MPSSYTTSLRLTLPATGELSGTWGSTVNTGITELLDAAVAGTATISTWGGAGVAYTLSNNSGTADEARKMFIVATGSPGEAKNVICPAVSKFYVFRNDTAGGYALTLKTSGGTGIAVPAGQYKFLYCDGTNVVEAFNSAGALTLSGALTVGGTTTLASNPTLSAGTANGVTYLNASKVLTSGSALTFDGASLTVPNGTIVSVGYTSKAVGGEGGQVSLNNTTDTGTVYSFDVDGSNNGRIFTTVNNTNLSIGQLSGTGGNVLFFANGGEGMRLTSTGLGIGTSSPATKLHVDTGAAGYGLTLAASSLTARTYRLGLDSAANFALFDSTAAAVRLTLDISGNLGLGVTPSAWSGFGKTMEFNNAGCYVGNSGATSMQVGANNYFNGSNYIYSTSNVATRYAQASGQHQWYISTDPTPTAGNAISFTQAMTLDASGNLGVGTTSTSGIRLGVDSGSAGIVANFNSTNANGGYIRFQNSGTSNGDIGSGANIVSGGAVADFGINTRGANNLILATNSTERARITSGGDLLVGTTTSRPASTVAAVNGFTATNNGSANPTLQLFNSNAGTDLKYWRMVGDASGNLLFETVNDGYSAATERARITSGGDLLVGTTSTGYTSSGSTYFSPAAQYWIGNHTSGTASGTRYWGFGLDVNELGSITQNSTTGVLYNVTSDRRLKNNITPAPNASNDIDAIQIVSHGWKSAPDEHVKYGVIAQDLHAVAPQAVKKGDDGEDIVETWGVDYSKLVPMLIKEIQSLRARVAALEA